MHARNRGAAPKIEYHKTEKMLSRKRFGRPKVLRRGEGDTDDLVRNLDSLDVKAGENPKMRIMISCLVLSASLRATCKLMVFGRRMITKMKKQKGKSQISNLKSLF